MTNPHSPEIDYNSYDLIVLYFSGGKDSLACLLHLVESGVDMSKVEIHHHAIDGEGPRFMDWACTESYCEAVADYFGLPYVQSWRVGGFYDELMKEDAKIKPVQWQSENGSIAQAGGVRGKTSTRLMWPAQTGDLSKRYCSANLKIDVGAFVLRNEPRFQGKKVLTVSGERAEESAQRCKYAEMEADRTDNRQGKRSMRHVDRCRPIHKWSESDVWAIIERHAINPHPCYYLGFGRASCQYCIFGSGSAWATNRVIDPEGFTEKAELEELLDHTIDSKGRTVIELADNAKPYNFDPYYVSVAMSESYTEPVYLGESWALPAGAYGESNGPI